MQFIEEINQTFDLTIREALNSAPSNYDLATYFLSSSDSITRYVIGRNDQSIEVAKAVKIDGIIDDNETFRKKWNDIPILPVSKVPTNAFVVNCSTSISPIAVKEHLSRAGVKNIININELIHASNGLISWPWFVKQQREDFNSHTLEWSNLYESLADQESQQTLLDVVRYRLTADIKFMQEYSVHINDQYFEDFMHLKHEIFVDAGGFDGDTTEEFCTRYPNFKKVYLFEPSSKNIKVAQERLAEFRDIEFIKIGLSDKEEILYFNSEAGSASSISKEGNESIKVTALDCHIKVPVSFIKMDLEGWEMKALAGCAQHIKNDHPKLALAVYHKASDFREIPRYLKSLNPRYKLHLRHYTQGWSETIMYFTIPQHG